MIPGGQAEAAKGAGMSGAEVSSLCGGISTACTSVMNAIGAGLMYQIQGDLIEINRQIKDEALAGQLTLATIEKEIATDKSETDMKNIEMQKDAQAKLGKSAVDLKNAEAQLNVAKERGEQGRLTESAAKLPPAAREIISRFGRESRFLGKPV